MKPLSRLMRADLGQTDESDLILVDCQGQDEGKDEHQVAPSLGQRQQQQFEDRASQTSLHLLIPALAFSRVTLFREVLDLSDLSRFAKKRIISFSLDFCPSNLIHTKVYVPGSQNPGRFLGFKFPKSRKNLRNPGLFYYI